MYTLVHHGPYELMLTLKLKDHLHKTLRVLTRESDFAYTCTAGNIKLGVRILDMLTSLKK